MHAPQEFRVLVPYAPLSVQVGSEGYFVVPHKLAELNVLSSCGGGWDHVSVSTATRCPTWEEMHHIKVLWWGDDVAVMQLHPPASDYVNNHPFCLHLWRPHDAEIPLPPSIMVGYKGVQPDMIRAVVLGEKL